MVQLCSGSTLCLILAGCFDNSACKSGGGVQMHLINYLQPIYASLVAGHVFCTSNGMWTGSRISCPVWYIQPCRGPTDVLQWGASYLLSLKVYDVSSSWGQPAQLQCRISFKEVDKGCISCKNYTDGRSVFLFFSHPVFLIHFLFFLVSSFDLQSW